MVFRQLAKHFNYAKNFAGHVFNQATRAGGAIDKGVNWAHKSYNIVSPALRQFGVNTAIPDMIVNRGFDGYNQLRNKVVQGNAILNRTQGQLRAIGSQNKACLSAICSSTAVFERAGRIANSR